MKKSVSKLNKILVNNIGVISFNVQREGAVKNQVIPLNNKIRRYGISSNRS